MAASPTMFPRPLSILDASNKIQRNQLGVLVLSNFDGPFVINQLTSTHANKHMKKIPKCPIELIFSITKWQDYVGSWDNSRWWWETFQVLTGNLSYNLDMLFLEFYNPQMTDGLPIK